VQNYRTLSHKKTGKDTQHRFYKFVATPVLLYGSETWALNKSYKRKIETEEMRFLRYVADTTDEMKPVTLPSAMNYRYLI
jgi:hypothetical protein